MSFIFHSSFQTFSVTLSYKLSHSIIIFFQNSFNSFIGCIVKAISQTELFSTFFLLLAFGLKKDSN